MFEDHEYQGMGLLWMGGMESRHFLPFPWNDVTFVAVLVLVFVVAYGCLGVFDQGLRQGLPSPQTPDRVAEVVAIPVVQEGLVRDRWGIQERVKVVAAGTVVVGCADGFQPLVSQFSVDVGHTLPIASWFAVLVDASAVIYLFWIRITATDWDIFLVTVGNDVIVVTVVSRSHLELPARGLQELQFLFQNCILTTTTTTLLCS